MAKKKDKKPKKENKYAKAVEKTASKKKKKVQVNKATVYVKSSYNNTTITVTDMSGNVLAWSTPGVVGFSGSRKSTAYAATKAAEDVVEKLQKYGVKSAVVIVKGTGMGRQAAVKGLRGAGLKISSLSDHTPIPHGGTMPRKKPRGS
ncbi:30S ribosomal protein S11 [Candidatus Dojkabacteria bacterium]|uniref:Small ribosomal subunit protein uS11 n=1 Tax=Candidatus Dojkabacteria bacterium TaxID=2099670 RepID=A0A955RJP0_9BACT|nr:30S ribosomal protein S11 [Candidatus Dojkabacteria bacterium]